jgi:hypothetical protein
VVAGLLVVIGCAALQEMIAIRDVDFSLAGASGTTLAGIPIHGKRSLEELTPLEVARIAGALSRGALPLEGAILVRAVNPEGNDRARLVGMEWTLFLDDRETVSGTVEEEHQLPPGEPVSVPVRVKLDLLDFFDEHLGQAVAVALAVAGEGEPRLVRLEVTPSIQTAVGTVRYPRPVRIDYGMAPVR